MSNSAPKSYKGPQGGDETGFFFINSCQVALPSASGFQFVLLLMFLKGSMRSKGLTLRKQAPRKNTMAGKGVEHCGNRCLGREATWRRGLALWKQAPKEGSCLGKGFNIV
jgi:hypothetical protein